MEKSTNKSVSEFIMILARMSRDLSEEEVNNIKEMCILSGFLSENEQRSLHSALSLFRTLSEQGHISESNTRNLKDLFSGIGREDLYSKYLDFTTDNLAKQLQHLPTESDGGIHITQELSRPTSIHDDESMPHGASPKNEKQSDAPIYLASAVKMIPPKLRDYQKELAQPALEGKNTIICAPTGCGKTITAAEICKHHHDNHHDPKNFKALFIVNIRHLTSQQRKAFETHFDTRDLGTLNETETLTAVLKNKKVVMITAQILVNALSKKEVELSFFDMLIFDECHHTTLNHSYNKIMRNYLLKKKEGSSRLPFILGLSASLGVGKDGDAAKHIVTLCANMDVNCVSYVRIHLQDLEDHVHITEDDEVSIVTVSPRPDDDEFKKIIIGIMEEQEMMHIESSCKDKGKQQYESWIVQIQTDAKILRNRPKIVIADYLRAFNDALMLYHNTRAIDAIGLLDGYFKRRSIAKEHIAPEADLREDYELNHESKLRDIAKKEKTKDSPMLKQLTELLQMVFDRNHESKGIILCRTRHVVSSLIDFLEQEVALKKYNIKSASLVGQGNAEYTMSEADQAKVLKRFKDGKINILVATDIAQEGLDMPACNVVIRYNFVSNEIGTVQSRGRARASGKCYLIVERESCNEEREHQNHEKVKRMKEALVDLDRKSEKEFNDEVLKRQKELIHNEAELFKKKQKRMTDQASDVRVLCKECLQFLCYASDLLQTKDGHITCVSPQFKDKITTTNYQRKRVHRTTDDIGSIKCGKKDCANKLGNLINYKGTTDVKGYGLKVDSLIFENPNRSVCKTWHLTKWKKRTFEIKIGEP